MKKKTVVSVKSKIGKKGRKIGAQPKERVLHKPDPVIERYKQDVDRTLLRENLKLTPEERFRKLMELQRFAGELRRAGRQARDDRF
jgi:hypothetical protein